jgi:hypothetical protein
VVIEPVVRDADYDPVKMLTEFAPEEASVLYERLRKAVVQVERLDLERLDRLPAVEDMPAVRTPD